MSMVINARLMPLWRSYVNGDKCQTNAFMEKLKVQDKDIHEEFIGDWVVNKNKDVAFCALGAEHALEQINRQMKVKGLVGITLNQSARNRFELLLILPNSQWKLKGKHHPYNIQKTCNATACTKTI